MVCSKKCRSLLLRNCPASFVISPTHHLARSSFGENVIASTMMERSRRLNGAYVTISGECFATFSPANLNWQLTVNRLDRLIQCFFYHRLGSPVISLRHSMATKLNLRFVFRVPQTKHPRWKSYSPFCRSHG